MKRRTLLQVLPLSALVLAAPALALGGSEIPTDKIPPRRRMSLSEVQALLDEVQDHVALHPGATVTSDDDKDARTIGFVVTWEDPLKFGRFKSQRFYRSIVEIMEGIKHVENMRELEIYKKDLPLLKYIRTHAGREKLAQTLEKHGPLVRQSWQQAEIFRKDNDLDYALHMRALCRRDLSLLEKYPYDYRPAGFFEHA